LRQVAYAILKGKRLERTGVHRIVAGRIVAARDQNHLLVVGRCPNLVGIFAGVEPIRLVHLCAKRAVTVDAMDREGARVVVGRQQIFAGNVNAGVDRTRRQVLRLPMRRQCACHRIDLQRVGKVLVARHSGPTPARHDVEVSLRGMRPRVLDIGRQVHGAAFLECGILDVHAIKRELAADARVECRFAFGGLSPGRLGREHWRDRTASEQRREHATVHHCGLLPFSACLAE
jgi:hypothetical protein